MKRPPAAIDVDEAAKMLGVDPVTVRNMISRGVLGRIDAIFGRRKILVLRRSVERLIEQRKAAIDAAKEASRGE